MWRCLLSRRFRFVRSTPPSTPPPPSRPSPRSAPTRSTRLAALLPPGRSRRQRSRTSWIVSAARRGGRRARSAGANYSSPTPTRARRSRRPAPLGRVPIGKALIGKARIGRARIGSAAVERAGERVGETAADRAGERAGERARLRRRSMPR